MRAQGVAFRLRFPPALCALALLSCSHAKPAPGQAPRAPGAAQRTGSLEAARALSGEAHALLRAEGDLLWQRYVTGGGALPASAAEGHPQLFSAPSLAQVAEARTLAPPAQRRPLALLHGWMASLAVARAAAADADALDRARATLAFAAPGEAHPTHGERDLDQLLTDEPSAQRRAAIAEAESLAAAALADLALARDAAEASALSQLGLPAWPQLTEELWGATPAQLAQLAEQTLLATESVAARAAATASQQNLGLTRDRVRRADLPRMLRTSAADAEFAGDGAWPLTRATLLGLGLDPQALPAGAKLLVDSEPLPAKGVRPLALLVDPPADVRLSLRPAGGHEGQRALLHEAARALGGALTQAPPALSWEEAQLGDGSAAEATAQLFAQLACDPLWLRENTQLRGEPLDELVHACAARRLLTARRAAALVLFEIRRREGAQTKEAHAALYRGLLQRATLALFSDADAGRWPLETDPWLRAAATLQAALLSAQLESQLGALAAGEPAPAAAPAPSAPAKAGASAASPPTHPTNSRAANSPQTGTLPQGASAAQTGTLPQGAGEPAVWWRSPGAAAKLRQLWAGGRSLRAADAAQQLGATLDPAILAREVDIALSYAAPDPRPATQRPDYKFMQGDKRAKRKKGKKKHESLMH